MVRRLELAIFLCVVIVHVCVQSLHTAHDVVDQPRAGPIPDAVSSVFYQASKPLCCSLLLAAHNVFVLSTMQAFPSFDKEATHLIDSSSLYKLLNYASVFTCLTAPDRTEATKVRHTRE